MWRTGVKDAEIRRWTCCPIQWPYREQNANSHVKDVSTDLAVPSLFRPVPARRVGEGDYLCRPAPSACRSLIALVSGWTESPRDSEHAEKRQLERFGWQHSAGNCSGYEAPFGAVARSAVKRARARRRPARSGSVGSVRQEWLSCLSDHNRARLPQDLSRQWNRVWLG